MKELLSALTFAVAVLLYGAASALFYVDVVRVTAGRAGAVARGRRRRRPPRLPKRCACPPPCSRGRRWGTRAHVAQASFIAHVCPIHSVHFLLSVASLFASAAYLTLRSRFRIDALGLLVAPMGMALLLGTYFLGKPRAGAPAQPLGSSPSTSSRTSSAWRSSSGGRGRGALPGAGAAHQDQAARGPHRQPASARHPRRRRAPLPRVRLLLLTPGIVTGTYWAQKLESGSPGEGDAHRLRLRHLGSSSAASSSSRAAAGWRGPALGPYGTILGLPSAPPRS